ncbi:MAG: hypothetical protein O3A13_16045 [Proteobacteria bacterium]|nr:hypothetical protein [Pseudomonadota bacterium]MDA0995123.1 hypothetical protein [Pseudomonadota bacterium]
MRRWDSLVDTYIEEYVARGIHPATIENVHRELQRWGNWTASAKKPDYAIAKSRLSI